MAMQLVIGNYNYSSWSLRAWLFMKASKLDFEEIRLPLFTEQWFAEIGKYTPAGRVPVLLDGDLRVWDTFAIIEHLRERHEGCLGWPQGGTARALGRSVASEMHSGFLAVREEMPMNIRARSQRVVSGLRYISAALNDDSRKSGCRRSISLVISAASSLRSSAARQAAMCAR